MKILVLLAVGLLILGVSTWLWLLYHIFAVLKSKSWVSTSAEVTKSEVKTNGKIGPFRLEQIYEAQIEYRYKVPGRYNRGHTICAGGELNTTSDLKAHMRLSPYPVGAQITVYFNPKEPSESCIQRRGEGFWFYGVSATLCILLGLYFLPG